MKKVRVGIVGAGFAARYHVECLRKVYGVCIEITGVTSARPQSMESFGKERGIKVFDDVQSMLKHVDVIDICSPPYAHEEVIIQAARAGIGIICEKPLTGCFGPADAGEDFWGDKADKGKMLAEVMEKLSRISAEVSRVGVMFGYAENFIYAPGIQKEREIIEKTGAQVLRMTGEESHNGSESEVYGIWKYSGGGSLIGKGCHPLGALLYFKRVEGIAKNGNAIRPTAVSSRVHQITRLKDYQNRKMIRTDYRDVEDYGFMHVVFEDGTVGDVITSEIVLGGIYDYVEVFANNHRTRCNLSPVEIVNTYNPRNEQYANIYTIEKVSTKEGWSAAAPDENMTMGYQAEIQDFISCAANEERPQSDLQLAIDITAVIYAAYVSDQNKGEEVKVPLI